jgi:hypothetical protein
MQREMAVAHTLLAKAEKRVLQTTCCRCPDPSLVQMQTAWSSCSDV